MFRFDTLHWVCLNVTHNFMLLAASFTLSILVECSLIDIFVHHAIDGHGNKMRDSRTPPQPFWDVNKKAFNIRFAGLRQAIFLNTLDHIRTHTFFQYPVWCRWLWWKNRQISRTPNYLFRHSQKYALRVKKSDEMETMNREKKHSALYKAINNVAKWIFMCCLLFKYTFGPKRCYRAAASMDEYNVWVRKKNEHLLLSMGYAILSYFKLTE